MRVVDNVGFDVKKQDIPGGGSGSGSGGGDYVSKNGDTINGDLTINGILGVNSLLKIQASSGTSATQIGN